jgi:thiol:disulfide interchange protein
MKHLLTFIILITAVFSLRAQETPAPAAVAKWEYTAEKKGGQEYILHLKGTVEKGWKLFSTTMKDDEPNTRIVVDSVATVTGITEEGDLKKAPEPLFDNIEIRYFENQVTLLVAVKLNGPVTKLEGVVNYMALKGEEVVGPEEVKFRFKADANGDLVNVAAGLQESATGGQTLKRTAIDKDHPVNSCGGEEGTAKKSLWGLFILGVIGGFIALLTPCVFPMIPLTVSFLKNRRIKRQV